MEREGPLFFLVINTTSLYVSLRIPPRMPLSKAKAGPCGLDAVLYICNPPFEESAACSWR